jgi:hypothetical protein
MRQYDAYLSHYKLLKNKNNLGGGTLGPRGLPLLLYTQLL